MNAVITADIVNSTALSKKSFKKLLDDISLIFRNDKMEIYRGDSFQVFMNDAKEALLACVRSRLVAIRQTGKKRIDIRCSIGIGEIKSDIVTLGSNMEEPFINSGRYFDKFQHSSRKLYIVSGDEEPDFTYEIIAEYLDSILDRVTPRQAEVLSGVLSGKSQVETAAMLDLTPATISQHVKAARLDEIETLLEKYKVLTQKLQHG